MELLHPSPRAMEEKTLINTPAKTSSSSNKPDFAKVAKGRSIFSHKNIDTLDVKDTYVSLDNFEDTYSADSENEKENLSTSPEFNKEQRLASSIQEKKVRENLTRSMAKKHSESQTGPSGFPSSSSSSSSSNEADWEADPAKPHKFDIHFGFGDGGENTESCNPKACSYEETFGGVSENSRLRGQGKLIKHHYAQQNNQIFPGLWKPEAYPFPFSIKTETVARHLSNIGNATLRQTVAVGIPTYLRQLTAMGLQHVMESASPAMNRGIAIVAISYPILMNVLGLVGDRMAGRQMEKAVQEFCEEISEFTDPLDENDRKRILDLFKNSDDQTAANFEEIARTKFFDYDQDKDRINQHIVEFKEKIGDEYWNTSSTEFCRIVMIGMLCGATAKADQMKLLEKLAPPLVAFMFYCQSRDVAQSFVVLNDGIKKFYLPTAVLSAACYFINQLIVNSSMNYFAAASGASAANTTFGGNGTYADVVGNDITRAALNTFGEIADIMVLATLQCWAMNQDLVLKLEWATPSLNKVWKTATGIHAARANLFAIDIIAGAILAHSLGLDDSASVCVAGIIAAVMSGLIDAGLLGICYTFFLGIADRANWPRDSSIQSGGEAIR